MPSPPQVLVVGAGPTGLMMALQLARRGVGVRIVDRHQAPSIESKAAVVQARSLEFLQQLGLSAEAVRLGRALARLRIHQRGRCHVEVPLLRTGLGQTEFPFVLALGQNETEAILIRALEAEGVVVERGVEAHSVEELDDRIRVRVLRRGSSVEEMIDAAWLCACDGASSTIRHALGVPFEGGSYEHRFYLADCRIDGPISDDGATVCIERHGLAVFFSMAGERRFRVIGKLPDELEAAPHPSFEQLAALAMRTSHLPIALSQPRWSSIYRIHHRAASRLRIGRSRRLFLLGDAAHVHSPVGGQGMNTGLQDAANLAWKLALVVHGAAREALLDTYEEERLPVIRALLRTTDRIFTMATSGNPMVAALRAWWIVPLLARALRLASSRRRVFATVSQIAIGYERRSLAREAREAGSISAALDELLGAPGAGSPSRGRAAASAIAQPGGRLPFVEVPGDDARPRSLVEFCRGAWFTALMLGGSREDLERARTRSEARLPTIGPAGLLAWRRLGACAPSGGAATRIMPSARSRPPSSSPLIVIVRPDLHCFGCWPLERLDDALVALRTAMSDSRSWPSPVSPPAAGA